MSDDRTAKGERHSAGAPQRPVEGDVRSGPGPQESGEFAAGGEPSVVPMPPSENPARIAPDAARDTAGSGSTGSSAKRLARPDDATHISQRAPLAVSAVELARITQTHRELEGERLEHFELQELVGGGGMGAVFRAVDTRLNRIVAIKILAPEQAGDEEKIRRFRNEAQSAARLDHDNVARVYYVGEDRGLHFIAFEYIGGTNIRDLVQARGPLPVAEALVYCYQIAEALAHASSRDVVHRDIKPSNVIVTEGGRAKLVDMGLARLHDDQATTDLTASGVTLGTFDYISPEQALDPRDADAQSDIYSLGCTLYFMLTGRPPFPEGTPLQKLLHHHSERPTDPRELNGSVPDSLATLVQRMMAKDPKDRPASPVALVRELSIIAGDLGLAIPAGALLVPPPHGSLRRSLERQLPWLVPVAALLIVVGILEGLAIWPPGGTSRIATGPPSIVPEDSGDRESQTSSTPEGSPTGESTSGSSLNGSPSTDGSSTGGTAPGAAAQRNDTRDKTESSKVVPAATPSSDSRVQTTPVDQRDERLPLTTDSPGVADSTPRRESDGTSSQPGTTNPVGTAPRNAEIAQPMPARENAAKPGASTSPATESNVPIPIVGGSTRPPRSGESPSTGGSRPSPSDVASIPEPNELGGASKVEVSGASGISVEAPGFDPIRFDSQSTEVNQSDNSTVSDVAAGPMNPPIPAAGKTGLRIVDPTQSGVPYVYSTLRAACAAAQDGDVIELRYDGVREERPFESRNRRLTIRAGENFEPIVRFRPIEVDPLEHPRNMMTIAGGRVTLVNLVFELDLTLAMPAEGWSLFQLQQAELVRLEDCALTVRNMSERGSPQHADVSFFKVVAPPGTTSMIIMSEDPAPPLPTVLELKDSIARGEAVFLRVDDLQPASLAWQNGFLATSQWLLMASGGAKEPQHAGRVQLDLRHVTAAMREGLCLLTDSADAPFQLSTEVRCTDSIVMVGSQGALIEQSGVGAVGEFRKRLKWESDRNFFDGFSVFWKIRGRSTTSVEEMTLSPWNAFWGGRERSWGPVVWREPPDISRPPHLQTVDDFAISDRSFDNPARRGATDGRDAGCEASQLPSFSPNSNELLPENASKSDPAAEIGSPPAFRLR